MNKANIRFVLSRTTHPGNIGASARALKNMGFSQLYLVSTANPMHSDALARASGAEDILQSATQVSTLTEAIADCHVVLGTSARTRSLSCPLITAKEAAIKSTSLAQHNNIAFLFGQERTGLTNEELALCHYHVYIPCNPSFSSLNLAAAVQIIAYELQQVENGEPIHAYSALPQLATLHQMENFYQHLEKTLIKIKFLDPSNPRHLMRKLKRLFGRASVEENELNILRGVLTAIDNTNAIGANKVTE